MDKNTLVSVCVVTYNSSKTVLETLESIKKLSYKNIELIVSDDNSKDDTVNICKKWLEENGRYFELVSMITSDVNTGIACNANRALERCHGEWIKFVAGDDMLLPNSIELYLNYADNNPDCKIIEGKSICFGSDNEIVRKNQEFQDGLIRYFNRSSKQMYRDALRFVFLAGPPLFMKKSLFDEIGGFDNRYPCCEEFTLQVKVLKRTTIYYLNEYVYRYRVEQGSLSRNGSTRYKDDVFRYFDEERAQLMLKEHMYLSWWDEKVREIIYRHNYPEIVNDIILNSSVRYWCQRFRRWFHIE